MRSISKLVLATHNPAKVREIGDLLKPLHIEVLPAVDLGLPEPDETGTTFAENAVLKALLAAQASSLPALADDSGLSVNGLNGNPGIFSARWAGPDKDFDLAMKKIHDALGANLDRSAAFVCTLALACPDGDCEIFEGRIEGTLVWPPRGTGGFGYDPMFQPMGETRTFGEMSPAEKKAVSHRAQAFSLLVDGLLQA